MKITRHNFLLNEESLSTLAKLVKCANEGKEKKDFTTRSAILRNMLHDIAKTQEKTEVAHGVMAIEAMKAVEQIPSGTTPQRKPLTDAEIAKELFSIETKEEETHG